MYGKIINLVEFCLKKSDIPIKMRFARKMNDQRVNCLPKELFRKVDSKIEKHHLECWGRLFGNFDLRWLRFYCNMSGLHDWRYVPEDIYSVFIDRILNDFSRKNTGCGDKNLIDIYVDKQYLPQSYLRFIRGSFMDGDYNVVQEDYIKNWLRRDHGSLVGKVPTGSMGGHGVRVFHYVNGQYISTDGVLLTDAYMKRFGSYVVQEQLRQCDFTARFNPTSCNTFRMVTLRCPWNGETVLLKSGFRIGLSETAIDNLSAGGICVPVDSTGKLFECAFSYLWYGNYRKFDVHPLTGVPFSGARHPNFNAMKQVVLEAAQRIPYYNIIGWDVVVTSQNEVKILEANDANLSTDWVQYQYGPLFGEYTERVISWCCEHKDLMWHRILNIDNV